MQPILPSSTGRVKTARLQLHQGYFDLSRSPLRVLASRAADERKTGVLKLRNGNNTAEIHFLFGQPHDAIMNKTIGLMALVRLVTWNQGQATWSDSPISLSSSLDPETAESLMNAT